MAALQHQGMIQGLAFEARQEQQVTATGCQSQHKEKGSWERQKTTPQANPALGPSA